MNKLTKIGITALAGSLAATSAIAGEMSVTGGATATYMTKEKAVTGNKLGMASGLTFKGSGELDNGNTFAVTIAHDDQNAYSTSSISLTVPGMGTFVLDEGGGTGLDRLDDKTPTAWEEAYDTGAGTGIQTVVGAGGSNDIEWAIDSGMLPEGVSAWVSYSPKPDGSKATDKSVGGSQSSLTAGSGWDVVVEYADVIDGLSVFAGASEISQAAAVGTGASGDRTSHAVGATYKMGSVTVGYQESRDNRQDTNGGNTSFYDNEAFGIAFNVNDDLAISYNQHTSMRDVFGGANVEAEAASIQISYTMGGMSIRLAETETTNAAYSTAVANDYDTTTVQMSLAF